MKYQLLVSVEGESLEVNVNKAIAEGWKPFGGVAVSAVFSTELPAGTDYIYAQAMIFENER